MPRTYTARSSKNNTPSSMITTTGPTDTTGQLYTSACALQTPSTNNQDNDGYGNFFLRQIECAHQMAIGLSLLDRVQVFALNVLNQRHLKSPVFRDVLNDHRDFL